MPLLKTVLLILPGGGGGIGNRVSLRPLLHAAVVGSHRKLKLGVDDSVVGGHESVDRVRTDRAGPVQLLLLLLDRGCGRPEDVGVVARNIDLGPML